MLHTKLLSKDKIIKTSERDPAKEYYLPFFGYFFRSKMAGVFKILKTKATPKQFSSLCEIGYGSGALLPFLSQYTDNLFGVELHNKLKEVQEILETEGIKVHLLKGDITNLPIRQNSFDVVVCLSLLEHLRPEELESTLLQVKKALKNNGFLIVGFPGENIITTTLFSLFYGSNHREIHISNPKIIKETINKVFIVEKIIYFPFLFGNLLPLYYTCLCKNRV